MKTLPRRLIARLRRASRTPKGLLAIIATVIALSMLIEHGRHPIWFKNDKQRIGMNASIHRDGDDLVLRADPDGRVGTLSIVRTSQSVSDWPLVSRRRFHTRFQVKIDGQRLRGLALDAWRRRAALHFISTIPLERRAMSYGIVWTGYPGDWCRLLVFVTFVAVPVVCLMLFLEALVESARTDRSGRTDTRRRRLLRSGVCPACRYDIRNLPMHRCPECGEAWTDDELRLGPA